MNRTQSILSTRRSAAIDATGGVVDLRFPNDVLGRKHMAFVNELISDEDKKKIDWKKFRAWPFSSPHEPTRWTVDHDRGVFLVRLAARGRDNDHPEVYAFFWKDSVIRFEAEVNSTGNPATGSDVHWKVFNLTVPFECEKSRAEILRELQEAITTHGALYRINPVNSVHITFA